MYDRAVVVNREERSAEKDDDWSGARPVSGGDLNSAQSLALSLQSCSAPLRALKGNCLL